MFGQLPVGPSCPILTDMAMSLQEAVGEEVPELRAYKLGKKRWSYNQIELIVCEEGGNKQLTVKQAVHAGSASVGDDVRTCGVQFEITLWNDEKLMLDAFLCYDSPKSVGMAGSKVKMHEWTLVDRCSCKRGCSGPVLRPIQRYGKLGKRSWGGSPSPDISDRTNHNMKDARYMYLSFDEAGTHVSHKNFRLVTAVYDSEGTQLTTAASPPVRVLANNDVPTGAAHLQLVACLPSEWKGWKTAPAPGEALDEKFDAAAVAPPQSKTIVKREPLPRDSPSTSEDNASNTPLRMPASAVPSNTHYRTRRTTAATNFGGSPPSPRACLSTGEAPSSLLVDASTARMTPEMEVASAPLQRCGGSLNMWLDPEAQCAHPQGAAPADAHAGVTAHITIPGNNIAKRSRVMGGIDSTVPLPHSVDFEPHFPGLGRLQQYPAAAAAVAAAAAQGGTAQSDDPIAAFVELMMAQNYKSTVEPIVELPAALVGAHHPDAQAQQAYFANMLGTIKGMSSNAPASPVHNRHIMHNIPGTPPSMATPTPSALDDLFGGIHATFDSIMQDDASFPPLKLPTSPFASVPPVAQA